MATTALKKDVRSGALFVFGNCRRTRLKILYFDGSGIWLLTKRLEEGIFSWPQGEEKVMQLRPEAFAMLTDGVDLKRGKRITCNWPDAGRICTGKFGKPATRTRAGRDGCCG